MPSTCSVERLGRCHWGIHTLTLSHAVHRPPLWFTGMTASTACASAQTALAVAASREKTALDPHERPPMSLHRGTRRSTRLGTRRKTRRGILRSTQASPKQSTSPSASAVLRIHSLMSDCHSDRVRPDLRPSPRPSPRPNPRPDQRYLRPKLRPRSAPETVLATSQLSHDPLCPAYS